MKTPFVTLLVLLFTVLFGYEGRAISTAASGQSNNNNIYIATPSATTAATTAPTVSSSTYSLICHINSENYGFEISGETGQFSSSVNNTNTATYGATGRTGITLTLNETRVYTNTKHSYSIAGVISVDLVAHTVSYEITATGTTFGNTQQSCSSDKTATEAPTAAATLVGTTAATIAAIQPAATIAGTESAGSAPLTLGAPAAILDLWRQWAGKYVLYAHKAADIKEFKDLNGKGLFIAQIDISFEEGMNAASVLMNAGGIRMNISLQNNDIYAEQFRADSQAVGFMTSAMADHFGFAEDATLVLIDFK